MTDASEIFDEGITFQLYTALYHYVTEVEACFFIVFSLSLPYAWTGNDASHHNVLFTVFAMVAAMFCHRENGLFQAESLIAQRNLYIRAGGELPAVIRKEFMIGGRERLIHKSLDEVLVSNLKWYGFVTCLLFAHVLTLFSRLQAFPERGIVKKTLCNVWRALRCKIQPIETISKTCEQSMSSSPLWSTISAC